MKEHSPNLAETTRGGTLKANSYMEETHRKAGGNSWQETQNLNANLNIGIFKLANQRQFEFG